MTISRSIETLDLVGGTPALDFANTINSRVATTYDYIRGYDDLLAWAERANVITRSDRVELFVLARSDPNAAATVVRAAHRRRDAIFDVFSALAANRRPPVRQVRAVMAAYADAVARSEAAPGPDGARLTWPTGELARPLRPIDYDAGRLLLSADAGLVKECPSCRWLFADRSRNRSRRWCDMQVCGARSKMRRYHRARRRAGGTAARPDPGP